MEMSRRTPYQRKTYLCLCPRHFPLSLRLKPLQQSRFLFTETGDSLFLYRASRQPPRFLSAFVSLQYRPLFLVHFKTHFSIDLTPCPR